MNKTIITKLMNFNLIKRVKFIINAVMKISMDKMNIVKNVKVGKTLKNQT